MAWWEIPLYIGALWLSWKLLAVLIEIIKILIEIIKNCWK